MVHVGDIRKGDFVLVKFSALKATKTYCAQVIGIDKDDIEVDCLRRQDGHVQDRTCIQYNQVMSKLEVPTLRRERYLFSNSVESSAWYF